MKKQILILLLLSLFLPSSALALKKDVVNGTITLPPNSLGLVAHWTFDGKNMTQNVQDTSGQGNNGIFTNLTSTTTIIGKIGQALSLSSLATTTVSVASPTWSLSTNASVSFWVNPRVAQGEVIMDQGWNYVNNEYGWVVSMTGALPGAGGGATLTAGTKIIWGSGDNGSNDNNGSQAMSNTSLPVGVWSYIVITKSGTTINTYINGQLDVSQNITRTAIAYPGGTNFSINRGYIQTSSLYAQGFFQGGLDDVRIYNRALSASEVSQLYKSYSTSINTANQYIAGSGMVGHWTFDGKNITKNIADISGSNNTGYLIGFSSTTTTPGKAGQALSFNGTNNYMTLPSAMFAYPTSGSTSSYNLSFVTWFKTSSDGMILGQDDGTAVGGAPSGWVPAIYIDTAGKIRASMFWHGAVSDQIVSTATYNNGKWHQLADVYNSGVETLYVDGNSIGTQTQAETGYSGTYSYWLGTGYTSGWTAGNNSWFYFSGALDDTRLYNRALSPSEVSQLYKSYTTKLK